jgi:hypothetical protein
MTVSFSLVSEWNGRGVEKAIKQFQQLETTSAKTAFAIRKAAVPAAAALAGLAAAGGLAVKAAMEDQASQVQLAGALTRTLGATQSMVAANEEFISKLSLSSAVADDQLRPALQSLVTGTKDLTSAQNLLQTALDVSSATGRDLGSVSDALSKGFNGNTKALAQLSPELKLMIKNGASFDQVLRVLTANYGGANAAAANTAQGGFKKFQNAVNEAQESIGNALVPAMAALAPFLVSLAQWAGRNAPVLVAVGTAMAAIAGGVLAANAALAAWRAIGVITTAVNAALATSFTAVQIATGVGILTAIAGVGVYMKLKDAFKQNTAAAQEYAGATGVVIASQKQLNDYVGPVLTRNFNKFWGIEVPKGISAADTAKSKVAQLAQKLRSELAAAVESANQKVQGIRDSMESFAGSIRSTLSGFASLSSAMGIATDSEKTYQDALKERASAYEELNALEAERAKRGFSNTDQITYDADQYSAALKRVAAAETSVGQAQANKKDYTAIFASQIQAAKSFGYNLQRLSEAGLGTAGIQQLLDLGPVAGAQVAQDLLNGVGGLSVAGLNIDLGILGLVGQNLGNQLAGVEYGGALGMAQNDVNLLGQASVRGGNNVTIQVNGGDPNAVVDALRRYMQLNGSVPIRIGTL